MSIPCRNCQSKIYINDPLFIYQQCAACVQSCTCCNVLLMYPNYCNQCEQYKCDYHTNSRYHCPALIRDHNDIIMCVNCKKLKKELVLVCANINAQYLCNDCRPMCRYKLREKCQRYATSYGNYCEIHAIHIVLNCAIHHTDKCRLCFNEWYDTNFGAMHRNESREIKRYILHPDVNQFYLRELTIILRVFKMRHIPRPVQFMILEYF